MGNEILRPVLRTVVTMPDYVRAVCRNWFLVGSDLPSEASVAVLYAQYMIETGGRACWGWNIGNAKHVKGDGHDYHMLNGVWEGVTPSAAGSLVASGQAVLDRSADHAKAVGPGKVSVIFQPPHPATWFRSYATLDEGMASHLKLLARRFAKSWPALLSGDYVQFAHALHAQRYFTASPEAYAAGMKAPYKALIDSTTYEELTVSVAVRPEVEPQVVQPEEASLWDTTGELATFISVMHQGASFLVMEDLLRDRNRRLID